MRDRKNAGQIIRVCAAVLIATMCLASISMSQRRESSRMVFREDPLGMSMSSEQSKSKLLAGVLSLVLPGMGEWYVGDLSSGQYHIIAEGSLWLAYGGMRTYSSWIRSDAHSYAAQHAGASFSGKDEDFESNIGDYISMDEYNQQMLRNREYDKVYSTSAYFWQWQSTEQQGTYRGERVRADRMKNNAQFAIAGLVINRVISAFGAVRAASRYNREHATSSQIDLYVAPNYAAGDGLKVVMMAEF